MELKVQNVVALVKLQSPVSSPMLQSLNSMKRSRFPGTIIKLNFSGVTITALIFDGSRNIVVTGARGIKQAYKAIHRMIDLLFSLGAIESANASIKITNIVATGDMGFDIDVIELAMMFENIIYEPEGFPGAIHWLHVGDGYLTFLIFSSGRFVCTGGRSLNMIRESAEKLRRKILLSGVALWRR